ncbi:hypothetical protein ABB37_02790 [Leptomonas pyrrhocoris]|uniref:Secreted protein n=1 Tax=Leptomonas pyrrhocoris TaxID=157538 RepID=A0A0N0DXK0_LEPPY|nr:hypothetical protein ABB37_02790 [Leptomonas pyrrhocoris]KPA83075.1 hypothetical protein ABB37_02790 [Leptomonas pyrrhocoris]|eukprot:XP_015661514.1 hypothetical protein ABB37_02790 [Leptomonas pyrrhocoris]
MAVCLGCDPSGPPPLLLPLALSLKLCVPLEFAVTCDVNCISRTQTTGGREGGEREREKSVCLRSCAVVLCAALLSPFSPRSSF